MLFLKNKLKKVKIKKNVETSILYIMMFFGPRRAGGAEPAASLLKFWNEHTICMCNIFFNTVRCLQWTDKSYYYTQHHGQLTMHSGSQTKPIFILCLLAVYPSLPTKVSNKSL
jgi:hypothetical protein